MKYSIEHFMTHENNSLQKYVCPNAHSFGWDAANNNSLDFLQNQIIDCDCYYKRFIWSKWQNLIRFTNVTWIIKQ